MNDEQIYQGPTGEYIVEIALILLGAFILGYLLRYLLNDGYKEKISDLEHQLTMQSSGSANESQESIDELKGVILEKEKKIRDLNDRLSGCLEDRARSENALSKASLEIKRLRDDFQVKKEESNKGNEGLVYRESSKGQIENSKDDLKRIEGVGPKIEQLLNEGGINTYKDLISTTAEAVKAILLKSGPTYAVHDPSTWAEQARLASELKWDELKKLQDELKGGKRK